MIMNILAFSFYFAFATIVVNAETPAEDPNAIDNNPKNIRYPKAPPAEEVKDFSRNIKETSKDFGVEIQEAVTSMHRDVEKKLQSTPKDEKYMKTIMEFLNEQNEILNKKAQEAIDKFYNANKSLMQKAGLTDKMEIANR